MRNICSIPDCDRFVHAKGVCQLHHRRWYTTGSFELKPWNAPRNGEGPHIELPARLSKKEWLIYAAGFVDGEGCISIYHMKKRNIHVLRISAPQLKPEPLYILQSLFGGKVNYLTPRKTHPRGIYKWEATSRAAGIAVQELAPYLIIKKAEAEVALQFLARVTRRIRNAMTEDELQERDKLRLKLSELKHS